VSGRPASSTIAQQPAGSTVATTTTTRNGLPIRQIAIDEASVSDPSTLQRLLVTLQRNLLDPLRSLGTNPQAIGSLLAGVTFTPGQTRTLAHGLGRAYTGWYCVRAQGNAASLVEAAMPPGVTAALVLPITSANAGTYSIWVF
jgi:hypothetical protein